MSDQVDTLAIAERYVIGSSLQSASAYERCAALLSGKDFYSPAHERIWDAITWLNRQGTGTDRPQVDTGLVIARLAETGHLEAAGGTTYVLTCLHEALTPTNATWYARQVVAAAEQRSMGAVGARLAQAAGAPLTLDDRTEIVADALAELERITAGGDATDPTALLADDLGGLLERLEGDGPAGVSTGLTELDEILRGLHGGQVIVVGARPGIGKSLFAQHVGTHVARDLGRPVLAFNLEMSRAEMLARLLCAEAGVNSRHLNLAKPAMTDASWEAVARALPKVTEMPLHVCDDESLTPSRLNALIGAFKRKHSDLGLVTVDYLGLMSGDGRTYNRQEEIAQISRELKKIAKRHNVPILVLSQLNRKSADRSDGKPVITDLRDSGAVEQDADIVILMHRDDAAEPEHARAGEVDLAVVKNRGGRTGDVVVLSQLHYYRLSDNTGWAAAPADEGMRVAA